MVILSQVSTTSCGPQLDGAGNSDPGQVIRVVHKWNVRVRHAAQMCFPSAGCTKIIHSISMAALLSMSCSPWAGVATFFPMCAKRRYRERRHM